MEQKEGFQIRFRKLLPILGGCAGVLLLLFGGLIGNKNASSQGKSSYYSVDFYTESLEQKVESLCMSISGITEAKVLLTLDCSTEYVYAQNTSAQGGDTSRSTDYLILNKSDEDSPVLLMEVYPKIRGIAVVCTGGDDISTKQCVIELLSAALGVSTNRIKVAGS